MSARNDDEHDLVRDIQCALELDQYAAPHADSIANALYYQSIAKYLADPLRRSWTITRRPTRAAPPSCTDWHSPSRPPSRGCEDC
jgi:hypothetical protein